MSYITKVPLSYKSKVFEKPIHRFAIASDLHFGEPGTNYQQNLEDLVFRLAYEDSGRGLDFLVFNGDLLHDDKTLLPAVLPYFQQLSMPTYFGRGNHDLLNLAEWEHYFGHPTNYVFDSGAYRFIMADSSDGKGSYCCADYSFLHHAFSEGRAAKGIFIFIHIAQLPWTKHAVDCPAIVDLIGSQDNVAGVFLSHDHDLDNMILHRDKPYFFTGHTGGAWGTPYRGFRLVEIFEDGEIYSFQCSLEHQYVNSQLIVCTR